MIIEGTKLDATQYTLQYELLRSQVMGAAENAARGDATVGQPRGVGLALLMSEGIPGWLETVEAVFRAALASRATESWSPARHEGPLQSNVASVWLSGAQRHEFTTLLASLVFSTRGVAHQLPRGGA